MDLPQPFQGWRVDPTRGDLIDDAGTRYSLGIIRAGALSRYTPYKETKN
jgi:hypothetical protein